MNLKKSIDVAMAKGNYSNTFVAAELNMTKPSFSQLKSRQNCTMKTIEGLASVFDMPVSEFIKLGE